MRKKNLMRNSFYSLLCQVVTILFGFASQRALCLRLGEALVGLNGVISNVISILSVSEMGISSAIVYHLYRAIASEDRREIACLMNLYRRAYCIFAAVITGLGLLAMPFLPYFLKDSPFSIGYVRLIYLLWLARTVFSYLLSYRRSMLIADQKEYIATIATLAANVLNYSSVILIVGATGRYAAALLANIAIEAAANLWLSHYVGIKYPFLKKYRNESLGKGTRSAIFANIKNIFIVRVAGKMLTATDNVIISGFISVAFSGRYSNYALIVNALLGFAVALSGAIQPSVGTLFARNEQNRGERMLRETTYIFFLFAASAGCGIFACANPMVGDFWLGREYVMDNATVGACVVNFVLTVLSLPIGMVMNVTGLFEQERNMAILSALANLVLSLGLVKPLGIYGVLLGTFAAYLIQMCYRIYVFYRVYMHGSPFRYVMDLAGYALLGIAELWLTRLVAGAAYGSGGFLRLLLLGVVSAGMPLFINLAVFCRSGRMKGLLAFLKGGL